ncbi:MAG TPA: oxygenase MpaB family protein [Roseiflexaceae bacterium]|nr:oxygenase MpaB family protein [Roseiflexaceae bacterium]
MISHPFTCPAIQRIWGSPDAILLFFAGGAAEFAAIKAVDWLFFTNRLPAAPIERFFETVRFAQRVFFGTHSQAAATIASITRIHRQVEAARGTPIPEWAYRDVLFLLIDYGERAHAIIYGPMSSADRQAHFEAILAIGHAMELPGLPASYAAYQAQRHQQLLDDYAASALTERLFASYRAAIGAWRYWLLRLIQASLLPDELRPVFGLRANWLVDSMLPCYRYLPGGGNKLGWLHGLLLPGQVAQQVHRLAQSVDGH